MADPNLDIEIIPKNVVVPDQSDFIWGGIKFPNPNSPEDLVTDKFNVTMDTAEQMLELLVGADGNSGYLGSLNSIISSLPAPDITIPTVTVPDLDVTVDSRPSPSMSDLDLDFPTFDKTLGVLSAIPLIDMEGLTDPELPGNITDVLSWVEGNYDSPVFTALTDQLLSDLELGVGGLGGTVEQDIYDRSLSRQAIDNDKKYQEIETYFSSRGFELPTGAMAGRLQEQTNEIARNNLDLNGKILQEQAELAQKNQQFIIGAMKDLEAVLRDYASKENDRSLDYAKALAANAIAIYAENIKGFIAVVEANKSYVQVQVENLRGTVEYNRGIVDSFIAESEAYNAVINGKGARNKAITDVYDSEIKGFDVETRAISENQKTQIDSYRLKIENADIQLKGAIADAESSIKGYTSESSLREKVAEAMANIAMQAMASSYGAVNASAGISYSGSESQSESFSHSESQSKSISHSASLSDASSVSQSQGQSESSSHVHSYEED